MSSTPIPIVLCGKKVEIVAPVVEALKPEYEVIDVIHTYEAAQTHLSGLLQGKSAADGQTIASPPLGTHAFGRPVAAVVIGGGFQNEEAEQILALSRTIRRVPYFRVSPPPAGAPPVVPGPEYGNRVAARVKAELNATAARGGLLVDGGELEAGKEDVQWA